MTSRIGWLVHWIPRLLCGAFAAFLALFALDVFGESLPIGRMLAALAMHLLPAAIVLVVLAIGWRWPLAGGTLLVLGGCAYSLSVVRDHHPLSWILVIAGPAFLVGGLFIADWVARTRHPVA